jgi:hypothetical protein
MSIPKLPTDPAAFWTMVGDVVQGVGVLTGVAITSRSVTRTLKAEVSQRRQEQIAEWDQRRREREEDRAAEALRMTERRRSLATGGIFEVEDLLKLVEDVHGPTVDITHPVLDRILEVADVFPRQTIGEMVAAMKAVRYFVVCRQSETMFVNDASRDALAKLAVLLEDLQADAKEGPIRVPRPYVAAAGMSGSGAVQGRVSAE